MAESGTPFRVEPPRDNSWMVGKQEIIGNNNQDPGGQARLDLSAP
jgi:hypothetical protein